MILYFTAKNITIMQFFNNKIANLTQKNTLNLKTKLEKLNRSNEVKMQNFKFLYPCIDLHSHT